VSCLEGGWLGRGSEGRRVEKGMGSRGYGFDSFADESCCNWLFGRDIFRGFLRGCLFVKNVSFPYSTRPMSMARAGSFV